MFRRFASLSLLLISACKSGDGADPVETICAQYYECDCTPTAFVDLADCQTSLRAELDQAKQAALDNGLVYDAGCVQTLADIYNDTIQCNDDLSVLLSDELQCSACAVVHGDKAIGEPCIEIEQGSSCAQGLICISGVCVDFCARQAEGEPCFDEATTTQIGLCTDGFFCDYLGTNACRPRVPQGEACTNSLGCLDGLYCDIAGTATCQTLPVQGEPCTFECAAGLACDMGTCGPAPDAGQPCSEVGVCAEGLLCDNNVCVDSAPLICESLADAGAL